MATNRPHQISAVALAAGLALALAACSSTGSKSGGGGAPTATTAGSTATAPSTKPVAAAGQGKLNGVPAACPSADVVMSNLNLSSLVSDSDDPSFCRYLFKGDKSAPYVVITFNAAPGMTAAQVKDGLTSGQSDVQPVSGLADAAFTFKSDGGGLGLTFLSGATVCSILTVVPTTAAEETALATAILGS